MCRLHITPPTSYWHRMFVGAIGSHQIVDLQFREEEEGDTDMPNGTVKWFNTTKGYGFIEPEEGGKDVFVHISAVERSGMKALAENQKLSYELQDGRDGRVMATELQSL